MLTTTTTTKGTKTAHYVPDYDQSNSMESHHTCPACGVQAHQMTNALSRTYACRNCGAIVCAHYDHDLEKVAMHRVYPQTSISQFKIVANSHDRCAQIAQHIAQQHQQHLQDARILLSPLGVRLAQFITEQTQCKPAHCGSFTKVSLD